jgi:hypothetical protein
VVLTCVVERERRVLTIADLAGRYNVIERLLLPQLSVGLSRVHVRDVVLGVLLEDSLVPLQRAARCFALRLIV